MRNVKTLGLLGTGVIGGGWAARALHFGIDVIAADVKAGDGRMDTRRGGKRRTCAGAPDLCAAAAQGHAFLYDRSQGYGAARRFHPGKHSRTIALEATHAGGGEPPRGGGCGDRLQHLRPHPDRSAARHGRAGTLLGRASVQPGVSAALGGTGGRRKTAPATIEAAAKFFTYIGMHPLRVRREVPGT